MGVYINPGNSGFAEIDDSDYVDKTLLIALINQSVGKKNKLTCVSRPRRFGKSFAIRKNGISLREVPSMIERALWKDLTESGFDSGEGDTLNDFLIRCVERPNGRRFVFIIDEWDAVIREAKDDAVAQKRMPERPEGIIPV